MKNFLQPFKQINLALFSLLFICSLTSFAKEKKWQTSVIGAQIQNNTIITVQDGELATNEDYDIESSATFLELKIDDLLGPFEWYVYTVEFKITPILEDGTFGNSYNHSLRVYNNRFVGFGTFIDLKKHQIANSRGAKVEIMAFSTEDVNAQTTNTTITPDNISISLSYESKRYYTFDYATAPAFYAPVVDANHVNVSWTDVTGAEEFELAWTWVDNYGSNYGSTFVNLNAAAITLNVSDYETNCTRIQTKNLSYTIPLIYDNGYLVFRIRAIGRHQPEYSKRKFGSWNTTQLLVPTEEDDTVLVPGVMKVSDWTFVPTVSLPTSSAKNWQFQASYAEDGKKKEVVSYFDGSLRNRQTLTTINSSNKTVVGEVIYDEEGRAAIEVLPVPIAVNSLRYIPNFNENMAGKVYSFQDFLSNPLNTCNLSAQGMNPNSVSYSASKYYSTNNTVTSTNMDFVPVANNYPFSQIQYSSDNTGRIKSKGGVGIDHQLGSGHEMKYFYSVPSQEELNRIFGYNVGVASHYKKNIVIDPNGQVSISYLDPQGRTIATALGASSPNTLQPLTESQASLHPIKKTDLLNKLSTLDKDTDLDNNYKTSSGSFGNLMDGLSYNAQKVFTENSGVYDFKYEMKNNQTFTKACNSLTFSYPFMYNLERKVINDCGTIAYSHNQKIGLSTPNALGYSGTNTTIFTSIFPLTLSKGAYEVSKKLTVDSAELAIFADDYITKGKAAGCILGPQDANPSIDDCFRTCAECVEHYESKLKFTPAGGTELTGQLAYVAMMLASNYDYLNLENPTDSEKALFTTRFNREFELIIEACQEPCLTDGYSVGVEGLGELSSVSCDSSLDIMLDDMSPNGQYGVYESDLDINGNIIESNVALDINQLPLTVYNDYMEASTPDNVENKIYVAVNGVNSSTPNWRNPHYYDLGILTGPITAESYKHYYTDQGQIDYLYINWNSSEQTFVPALVENLNSPTLLTNFDSSLVIDSASGSYKVEPQYLANVEDFIKEFSTKKSWALSLVKYHPEFHYLNYLNKSCSLQNAVAPTFYMPNPDTEVLENTQVFLNSHGLDALIGSYKTYEKAKEAGFLQNALRLYNADPFFQVAHPMDGQILSGLSTPLQIASTDFLAQKQSIMKHALDVIVLPNPVDPNTTDGNIGKYENSGLTMVHYIYKLIKCTNLAYNCEITIPSSPGQNIFDQVINQVDTNFTNEEKDLFWQYYVSFYVGLKQKIQHVFIDVHAARQGFYNGCIGNNDSENLNKITSVISKYPTQKGDIAAWVTQPNPSLKSENGSFLKENVKRFPPFDDVFDSESSDADIYADMLSTIAGNYLMTTGNCPRINDLTIFLGNFLTKQNLNAPTYANFTGNYLTPDLFTALGGNFQNNVGAGNVAVSNVLTNSNTVLTINFKQTATSLITHPITLTIPANGDNLTWANNNNAINATSGWKIVEVSQVTYSPPPVSGNYKFKFLAKIKKYGQNELIELLFTGESKAVLACDTDPATAADNGSVYVPPSNGGTCTKKEDFTNALKDLIVNLQSLGVANLSTDYVLNNNTVFNSGYLSEFFSLQNMPYQIKWSTFASISPNSHNILVELPGINGVALKMVLDLDLSVPIVSLSIGSLLPGGNGHYVTAVDSANVVKYGQIYGGYLPENTAAFDSLEFACCKVRSFEDNNDLLEDLSYADYLTAVKNAYNEILQYFESNFTTISENAQNSTVNVGYGYNINYNTVLSNNFLQLSKFYDINEDFAIYINGLPNTIGTPNNYNYSITIKPEGNDDTYLYFYFNEVSARIHQIQSTGTITENAQVSAVLTLNLADETPVLLNNGTTGEIMSYTKNALTVYRIPTCPCIPQTVQPVPCRVKYLEYVNHLQLFNIENTLAQINTTVPAYNFDAEKVFCGLHYQTIWDGYKQYLIDLQITSTLDTYYISLPAFGATELSYGYADYGTVTQAFAGYIALIDAANPNPLHAIYLGNNAIYYTNQATILDSENYELIDTWGEYAAYYVKKNHICPPAPMVPTIPIRYILNNDCIDYTKAIYETYNADAYNNYIEELKDTFKREYLAAALSTVSETFTLNYSEKEYQYTLYYYDQAGNLIQTVAPEGVTKLNFNTQTTLNSSINVFRNTNNETENSALVPNHEFKTKYRYNSLNQLVWQNTPDGGETKFAYDKLGRIVASQNGNQNTSLVYNLPFTLPTPLKKLNDGTISRITTTNTIWYGGNTSTVLPKDGYLQYTIRKDLTNNLINDGIIIGLSYTNSSNAQSVAYSFYIVNMSTVMARRNTTDTNLGIVLNDGDILKIERINGKIKWYRNAQFLYEVTDSTPAAAMLVDLAMYNKDSKIQEIKVVRYDLKDKFSYTRYDALGRIQEAGQMDANSSITINENGRLVYTNSPSTEVLVDAVVNNFPHNVSDLQIEVTKTLYDNYGGIGGINPNSYLTPMDEELRNSRNRVTAILTYDSANQNTNLNSFETAILYNYDIHGNVDEMVESVSSSVINVNTTASVNKRVNYEYDLISGNVNKVIFQKNSSDQFIHVYNYDADNRIINVETSKDNVIWEKDADYHYYDHGPLARVTLGDKQVQGIDYAYTLQGWLKTVNSESLSNEFKDMGNDGTTVSKDAFGYSLSYYNNDYQARTPGSNQAHELSASNSAFQGTQLFNGNINRMITSLRNTDGAVLPTQINLYNYDQLNRIFGMNSFNGIEFSGKSFTPSYSSSYTYDKNGNLKTLQRTAPRPISGGEDFPMMDNFTYNYQTATNKLRHINDAVSSTVFGDATHNIDIDNQVTDNYSYDEIGQLIEDKAENIKNIFWRVDGKVKAVEKVSGEFISFYYDGLGNRIAKKTRSGATAVGTHYSRDAQGNVMAVYDFIVDPKFPSNRLKEHHIYGSSRLGLQSYGNQQAGTDFERLVGDKHYELSNHLGNVLSVINDRKTIESDANVIFKDDFYNSKGSLEAYGDAAYLESEEYTVKVVTHLMGEGVSEPFEGIANEKLFCQVTIDHGTAENLIVSITNANFEEVYYEVPITNTGTLMIPFIPTYSGTFRLNIYLSEEQPEGTAFYVKNFSVYSIPNTPIDYVSLFTPDVESYNDYYPFGMLVPNRHSSTDAYRYGFIGMEKDDELKGEGNSYDVGARMLDVRIGRWFAKDPLQGSYPHLSPYNFVANSPLVYVDKDGKKIIIYYKNYQGKEIAFEYKPGIKPPNNKYVQNTVKMLDKLLEVEALKNIEIEGSTNPGDRLTDIIKSDKILHMIEIFGKEKNSSAYFKDDYVPGTFKPKEGKFGEFEDNGGFGTIKVNDEFGIEFLINGKVFTNSPTSQFGHEIIHAIHENECPVETQDRRDTKDVPGIGNKEEEITTKEANQINDKLKEPRREDYSGTMVKMDNPTVNKKANTSSTTTPTPANKTSKR